MVLPFLPPTQERMTIINVIHIRNMHLWCLCHIQRYVACEWTVVNVMHSWWDMHMILRRAHVDRLHTEDVEVTETDSLLYMNVRIHAAALMMQTVRTNRQPLIMVSESCPSETQLFRCHKLFQWVDLLQISSIGHVNIWVIMLFLENSWWFLSSMQSHSYWLFHIQSKLLRADWLTQDENGKVTLHFNMPYSHGLWNHQT